MPGYPGRMLTAASRNRPAARVNPLAAVIIDVCCVIVFVAIGRSAHHHGESAGGLASTAWPFLVGLGVGLLVTRAWRRPAAIVPAGIGAWLGTVAAGMLLRVVAGQGTAPAFVVVALCFLGLFMLGWRVLAAAWARWRPLPGQSGPP
jgi:Protein of unknown function (DUF3054)